MRSPITAIPGVTVLAATSIVAIAASCTDRSEPTRPEVSSAHVHVAARSAGIPDAELDRKLKALRRATEPYQSFAAAQRAGYTVEVTRCMEDATRGGMGYHYAKGALIDGVAIEARPEVLLYEPQRNGGLRLVGVEFIIPFTAWAGTQPPVLYGQTFARNETFEVWALHVWVWRKNPNGVFADWNPKVSCSRDDA